MPSNQHTESIIEFGEFLKRQNGAIRLDYGVTLFQIPEKHSPDEWVWLSANLSFDDELHAAYFADELRHFFTEYDSENADKGKPTKISGHKVSINGYVKRDFLREFVFPSAHTKGKIMPEQQLHDPLLDVKDDYDYGYDLDRYYTPNGYAVTLRLGDDQKTFLVSLAEITALRYYNRVVHENAKTLICHVWASGCIVQPADEYQVAVDGTAAAKGDLYLRSYYPVPKFLFFSLGEIERRLKLHT